MRKNQLGVKIKQTRGATSYGNFLAKLRQI